METLLWPPGCSSMLNCSFIADRQLSEINQRIKWLHNEWEHFSSVLNKTSEITSVDKNLHRACFDLPPPYLWVQTIGVHGILFPFSHNLVSAPLSPPTDTGCHDSKLNKNLRPVADGCGWPRLSLIWHSLIVCCLNIQILFLSSVLDQF